MADIKVEDLPPPPPKIEETIADLPPPPEEDSKTLANPFGDPGDPDPSSQPPKLVTEVPTPPEDAIIDEDTKNVELTLDLVTIKEPEPPLSPPSDEDSLGMISHKKSLITIFGHKHKIKNFIKNFDIFHEKISTASDFGSYLVSNFKF